ncbi:MAG: TatD family hydrolase [bacterium]|nr:TatD family hydrolase [bacterium]
MPLEFADTHCHLDQLGDSALEEAAGVGVTTVVAVAQEAGSMRAVLELARRFPGRVLPGLGIHPCTVTERGLDALTVDLALLAEHAPEAAVIGETGLDHKWATNAEQQAEQMHVLECHFDIAERHAKPVNLHSRRCLRQTLEHAITFHRETGLAAQMHWFTESTKLVHICNDEGIFVSAGPAILTNDQAAAVAGEIAADLLLLESDAPVPVGGVPGHPRRVREVAEKLARLRGVSLETLAEQLGRNLRRYLGPQGATDYGRAARPQRSVR